MAYPWRLTFCLFALAHGVLPAREPGNLDKHKQELRTYIESGEYNQDIARVAGDANAWLRERASKGGGKLAVVFDLDETLLSNLPELLRNDFGRDLPAFAKWFDAGKCTVIEPVREVYSLARELKLEIIYITGRPEKFRAGTLANLQAVGCGEFAEFIFKPADWKKSAEAFKTGERERLTKMGYSIIANIGDQNSDLAGGFAERTFKLPNPFYFSP